MAFTGNEDHTTTLAAAEILTNAFQAAYPTQTKGVYFSKATLQSILDQTNCVGIRFYFGLDVSNNKFKLAFDGVLANENDMTTGIIGNGGALCPPNCGNKNGLNS